MKKLFIVALILLAGWQYLHQPASVSQPEAPSGWNQQLVDQPAALPGSSVFSCETATPIARK